MNTHTVAPDCDGTFQVTVSGPSGVRSHIVRGFASEAAANAWVDSRREIEAIEAKLRAFCSGEESPSSTSKRVENATRVMQRLGRGF